MTCIAVIIALKVFGTHVNSAQRMPWLIVITAVPFFGICIYLLFGRSIVTKGMRRRFNGIEADILKNKLKQDEQIIKAKELIAAKYNDGHYIAYFQSFTNTYADVSYLRNLYMPVISRNDIDILSIATRPDCIDDNILSLLSELASIKPVWIELGLQTIHENTADYIRRGYSLDTYDNCVKRLINIGIRPIVHMIIGLPGESTSDILETADYIAHSGAWGIKLQLLHILKGTDLYTDYINGAFKALDLNEYTAIVGQIIARLPKDMVIHRITGDGPKSLLEAPMWSANKKLVLNTLNQYFKDNNIYQGRNYT